MKKYLSFLRFLLSESFRQPGYIIPTLIFPAMFFLFFGVPEAKDLKLSKILVASFSAFALIGVMFFQFLISSSQERSSSWNFYLRTLPTSKWVVFWSRASVSLFLAILSVGLVFLVAFWATPFEISLNGFVVFMALLLVGAIPFGLLGYVVGLWVNPKGAPALGNLLYLGGAYMGGLWYPPQLLPKAIGDISVYLPTRAYGEILWSVMLSRVVEHRYIYSLVTCSVVVMLLITFSHLYSERKWSLRP